jgi:hypothetical protein
LINLSFFVILGGFGVGQDITMLLAQAHEIMQNRYMQDSIVAKDV